MRRHIVALQQKGAARRTFVDGIEVLLHTKREVVFIEHAALADVGERQDFVEVAVGPRCALAERRLRVAAQRADEPVELHHLHALVL
jgi:hypothetical protein